MTLTGHLQSWPRKADYLSFGVGGLFEVEEETDTQAFDHGCWPSLPEETTFV